MVIGRVVAIIVDQLPAEKQRQPPVSQCVIAGRRWHGKYCFGSRGEQIRGGYPKTITFLNILGISFGGKMQRAFLYKSHPFKK